MTINSIIQKEARDQGWTRESRRHAIRTLWNSFPCLRSIPICSGGCLSSGEFDAEWVELKLNSASVGEEHCARFVLAVWNPAFNADKFNLVEAVAKLQGSEELQAIISWTLNPWFP